MTTTYTFLGHGAHQIVTGGHTLLVDPFLTNNPQAALTADEASPDFIFVSHGHGDHVGDTVEIAKRTGALVIANAEISGWLGKQGVKTHAQHIGGGFKHPFGYLKLTIAFHGSGLPDGSNGGNPAGIHLTTNDGKTIYIACDTGLFSDMALYGRGGLDLAVLPIGDNYTMGPDDALEAVKLLQPRMVVPCHYNTWPPIAQNAKAWAARVEQETDAKVSVLAPGESLDL
jgi:L-ascorbate metabolism protein UlaG (beta-lactamase superfamily)